MTELDNVARDMLAWIVSNGDLPHYTLAASFNNQYKKCMETSIETLRYLMQQNLVRILTDSTDNFVTMIEITHEGRMYEQNLKDSKRRERRSDNKSHLWDILILFFSSVVSCITSIITTNIKLG